MNGNKSRRVVLRPSPVFVFLDPILAQEKTPFRSVVLAYWKKTRGWKTSSHSQFPVLEEYLVIQLRAIQNTQGFPMNSSFSKIEDIIGKDLRSLGFEKF